MRSFAAVFAAVIPDMYMAVLADDGDNHFYIIASDNNDYRRRQIERSAYSLARGEVDIIYMNIYLWGDTPYLYNHINNISKKRCLSHIYIMESYIAARGYI